MELLENDFTQKTGLNEDQVNAVREHVGAYVDHVKGSTWAEEWSRKATTDAEAILTGATKSVETLTGIKREQGQKAADYVQLASDKFFEGTKAGLERKEAELDRKIREGAGDETIKTELSNVKTELSKLKERDAIFTDWEENDYKGKYESAAKELSAAREMQALGKVKPQFPDTVNPYEAKAKWNEFISGVKGKSNIVIENDEAYAVNKDNEHIKTKLSDLIKKDKDIQGLLKPRQLTGTGADGRKSVALEGVPFEVPEKATSSEKQKLVRDYLAAQGVNKLKDEYSLKFKELFAKISEKTPAN